MIPDPSFQVTSEIYASSESRVYRAVRPTDGLRVLIKAMTAQYPSPAQTARFEREYALLKQLAGPGIPTVLSMESRGHSRLMVFAEEGAEALARLPVPLSLETFFLLARELATILGRVHAASVLHKDVTPANVVFHPTRKLVQLIDFGLAAQLSRELHAANRPALLEGTLLYMSPEQTGRMNRGVDYRADYYGLGATLFYVLTGKPPFQNDDPLELVHCHIARVPPLACDVRSGVPRNVSTVLRKLLAKNPEDRYQSGPGLLDDLARCQSDLARGVDEEFALGSTDVSDQFVVSEVLHGRQEQIATLLSAFARVTAGAAEVLLLPGAPGIGKSALINEVQRPITLCRGLYAAGKFDQFNRGIPFSAVLQAFRGLLRQLLTEEEAQLRSYREALEAALGVNLSVITEVLPELALIVGNHPPPPELQPNEAQVRFLMTFQNLVNVLARKEHPLVLVLDDVQWADLSSLNLLIHLCTTPGRGHLLLMCAYRDGEVDEQHPFQTTMRSLVARGVPTLSLPVGPLAEADVRALVAATLRAPESDVSEFARLCLNRTAGNPFFLTQILRQLHRDGVIYFDPQSRRFHVSAQAQEQLPVATNVADLMSATLTQLRPEAQRALSLAACIGSEFDLATLSAVYGAARTTTADALWPALQLGMVLPLSGSYRVVADGDDTAIRYRFAHDRIQQVAYGMIQADDVAPTHHTVGCRLLAQLPSEECEQRLFEIVTHLNKGVSLRARATDRNSLAALNLRAARRAIAATAFGPAWDLLRTAIQLRGPSAHQQDYASWLELNVAAAEAAAYAGDLPAMDALVLQIERHARALEDKIRAREVRVQAYIVKGRGPDAIAAAFAHLRDLGEPLPGKPNGAHVMLELVRVKLALRGRSPDQIAALPMITNPLKHAAIRACMLIRVYAYATDPELAMVLGLRETQLSLRYGIAHETPMGFAGYGAFIGAMLGDIEGGVGAGRLALALAEQHAAVSVLPRVYVIAAWLTEPLVRPFIEASEIARKGVSLALEAGDLETALAGTSAWASLSLWGNRTLSTALAEGRALLDLWKRSDVSVPEERLSIPLQTMECLAQPCPEPSRISGSFFDADQYLSRAETPDPQALLLVWMNRAWLLYIDNRVDEAYAALTTSHTFLSSLAISWVVPFWHALQAALDAVRLAKLSRLDRAAAELRIARTLHSLRRLAKHNPTMHRHRIAIIEAERAASLGRDSDALTAFQAAIAAAQQAKLPAEEAIARERAAHFFDSRGQRTVALVYFRDACHAWTTWGALGRVQRVEERIPELAETGPSVALNVRQSSQGVSSRVLSQAFDATAVIQAAQAIADEMDVPTLLGRVMTRTIEHAGARRGALVLDRAGTLRIKAFADQADGGTLRMLDLPLGQSSAADDLLPAALARFVLRSGEPTVLDDAQAAGGLFAQDAWVRAKRARSLLALPLSRQGRVLGVLVLDNDQTTAAFTPDRIEALRVLATQAAIALDNAILQSELQTSLAEQSALARANQRFVPAEFLGSLGRHSITAVELGDSVQKELTILFSDMRGFTSHVEGNTPEQNIHFINEYLAAMEPAILAHGGFVDSYIGDAIMALFAVRADASLRASIDMLRNLEQYNQARIARGAKEIRIGIGLNTGVVTLGTIGGPQRIKCGVIGDAVNLGARVESLSKSYGVSLIVSSHTVSRLENPQSFLLRELDRVRVVGRQGVVTLYECFDADPQELRGRKLSAAADWSAALRASDARDFAAALAHLDGCGPLLGGDVTWSKRRARCARYLADPPPPSWDGIEEMTQK